MEVDWDDLIDLPSNKCVTYGPVEVAGHFWEVKLFPRKHTRGVGSPTCCTYIRASAQQFMVLRSAASALHGGFFISAISCQVQ